MSSIYSPVFSQATGWIVGIIENHSARSLTEAEVKEACNALISGAAKLAEVEAVRDEKHFNWNEAELDAAALRSEVKSLTEQRDRALKRVTTLSTFSIHAEHEARANLHAAEEMIERLAALLDEAVNGRTEPDLLRRIRAAIAEVSR